MAVRHRQGTATARSAGQLQSQLSQVAMKREVAENELLVRHQQLDDSEGRMEMLDTAVLPCREFFAERALHAK